MLFPLLGVLPADTVSRNYFKTNCYSSVASSSHVPSEPHLGWRCARCCCWLAATQLLLGFMVSTAFISMWMSNTATAAMMMPIAEAVLGQLEHAAREGCSHASSNSRQAQ